MTGLVARLEAAGRVLRDGIAARVFPGASAAVVSRGETSLLCEGRFTYDVDARPVTPETIYDLASLTKPIATATAAMVLYERGKLDLATPVVEIVPEFGADGQRRSVTVSHLMTHSSGLPAYVRLFETCATREELVTAALRQPLQCTPGEPRQLGSFPYSLAANSRTRAMFPVFLLLAT